jgi:hypothetical protein
VGAGGGRKEGEREGGIAQHNCVFATARLERNRSYNAKWFRVPNTSPSSSFKSLKPHTGWMPAAHFYRDIRCTRMHEENAQKRHGCPQPIFTVTSDARGCTKRMPENGTDARSPFLP